MNEVGTFIFILVLIGLGIFLLWFFIFKVKHLKTPDVYMVDGGVKVGKTLVTVKLAVTQYRKNCIKVAIFNFFRRLINFFKRLFKKPVKPYLEKPMLYSNMPLFRVKYNWLSMDIITMKVRIPHKSVCILDEASLIADSMTGMITDKQKRARFDEINETLTLFFKLYGHSTHGGSAFFNSQNVTDLHFAFRRNTACYLYVAHNRKFPFFCLLDVRELIHDESNDVVNTNNGDVEKDNRPLFISKRWYKYYDRYYLDVLTKSLPTYVNYDVIRLSRKDKKDIKYILTLGNFTKIKEYNERFMPKPLPVKEVKENEKEHS